MFRKLLLVGGFDMVQLIHITDGPIYLAHRIQQSILKLEILNFYIKNDKLTSKSCKRAIFQIFWKAYSCTISSFFEIETSNFGSSYVFWAR